MATKIKVKRKIVKSNKKSKAKASLGPGMVAVPQQLLGELVMQTNLHSQAIQIMQTNVQRLAKAGNEADTQIAVIARLCITRVNELVASLNSSGHHDKPILPEDVKSMFSDFQTFLRRPDFREHFEKWFFGANMSELPPVPVKKEGDNPAPSENPTKEFSEGAQVFGGDYGDKARNPGQDEKPAEEKSGTVPQV